MPYLVEEEYSPNKFSSGHDNCHSLQTKVITGKLSRSLLFSSQITGPLVKLSPVSLHVSIKPRNVPAGSALGLTPEYNSISWISAKVFSYLGLNDRRPKQFLTCVETY